MKLVRALAVASVLLVAGGVRADEASENAAVAAADAWLKLVDAGQYGASWDDAARLFRDAVSKGDWEKALSAGRSPLGKLVSRRVSSRRYTESLPGVPDGRYVIITYESSFENKKAAIETVTPTLDKDGRWRVSGYFIK
jgi:hypothetical protein